MYGDDRLDEWNYWHIHRDNILKIIDFHRKLAQYILLPAILLHSRKNVSRIQLRIRKFIALRLFHYDLDIVYQKFLLVSIKEELL